MSGYEEYDALPGIRWSVLKAMRTSPRHYLHRLTTPQPDTPAMLMGRAVHCAVLEPDAFPVAFTVYEGSRRGNAWLEFQAANAGRDILTRDEYARCLAIRDAVRLQSRVAADVLRGGEAERYMLWSDQETGLECKARADYIAGRELVDIKTTKDVSQRAFGRTCDFYRYASQLGYYRDGMSEVLGVPLGDVRATIIAVESDPPHDVAVYRIAADDLWRGSDEAHALLCRVRECEESGEWPGAHPQAETLELPPWTWGEETDVSDIVTFGGAR